MNEPQEFKITHLSVRNSVDSEVKYFYLNLVFKLVPTESEYPYLKGMLDGICADYCSFLAFKSKEEWEDWFEHPRGKTLHKRARYWIDNDLMDPLHGFITPLPKFNSYRFNEYFEDSCATRGLVQKLFDIKDGKPNTGRSTIECQFIRTLYALSYFWD